MVITEWMGLDVKLCLYVIDVNVFDANPLGFLPDLLMRDGDNFIGGWR